MASASGAQREPSMEEILASIRRIIEDNEMTSRRQSETETPPSRPEHRTAAEVVEVSAFRSELRTPFADVSASHSEPFEAFMRTPVETRRDEAEANDEAVPASPPAPLVRESGLSSSPALAAMSEEMEKAALETVEATLAAAVEIPAEAEDMPAVASSEAARGGIISERTGRQVAAAFGELSDAFAASRRRSFDEIAEEMMRPMLQDWLDNNLPTMVERLVREEIERIARGA
ncbi:MAG: DUF2497 domain-containing protein [Rhizobiaceae bacterium]|nr:DUF2497 domain-containing protein [Rhizobiaceae bacterium]